MNGESQKPYISEQFNSYRLNQSESIVDHSIQEPKTVEQSEFDKWQNTMKEATQDYLFTSLNNTLLAQTNATIDELHGIIADQLQQLTGSLVCLFSIYNEEEKCLITRNIVTNKNILNQAIQIIGKNIVGFKSPIPDDVAAQMASNQILISSTLTEASGGTISPTTAKFLQNVLKTNLFIGIPFTADGKIFGLAMIAIQNGRPEPSIEMLRFFSTMTSVSMRWKHTNEQLRQKGLHDALTGVYNRRFFDEEMNRLQNSRNYPISILMIDVNHMKKINDSIGHLKGDEVLQIVASIVPKCLRSSDMFARIGGDEFAVLLPQSEAYETQDVITRIQQAIDQYNGKITGDRKTTPSISLSIGMATAETNSQTLKEILTQADLKMYENKRNLLLKQ